MQTDDVKLRASGVWLFELCESSIEKAPEVIIDDMTPTGNAGHEALQIRYGYGREPDINAIADKWGADVDEVADLVAKAIEMAHRHVEFFGDGDPIVERQMAAGFMKGKPDIIMIGGRVAVVVDWKFGRADMPHESQLRSYAALTMQEHPGIARAHCYIINPRQNKATKLEVERGEVRAWVAGLKERLGNVGRVYRPGPHCRYCRKQIDCEPRDNYMRSSALPMVAEGAAKLATREQLGAAFHHAKALEAMLAAYWNAVRLAMGDGPLQTPDGAYELQEASRESVNARAAWPILREHGLTDDDMGGIVKISKGAAVDAVRAKHRGGKRGAMKNAEAALLEALRGAGAVTRKTHQEIRRVKDV